MIHPMGGSIYVLISKCIALVWGGIFGVSYYSHVVPLFLCRSILPRATSEGFLFSRSSAGAEMSFPPGTGGTSGTGFEFPRGLILCAGAVDESH